MRHALIFVMMVLWLAPHRGFSQSLFLDGAIGESALSESFQEDHERALAEIADHQSMDAMLALLEKYHRPVEQAALEVTIGMEYSQQEGVIDYAKAVSHLTRALALGLPEPTYLDVLGWRGSSYEQLKESRKALEDYLRGLVACAYYDTSLPWPEILEPSERPAMSGTSQEEAGRRLDYRVYRYRTDRLRRVLRHRFAFVDGVRRLEKWFGVDERLTRETLQRITPDPHTTAKVSSYLKGENRYPAT